MNDLIRKSDLIDWLRGKKYITVDETSDIMSEDFEIKHRWELSRNCFINDTIKYIQEQPTIEAELVVHGEWVPHNRMTRSPLVVNYACSECGKDGHKTNFCPNCGARMKGVET